MVDDEAGTRVRELRIAQHLAAALDSLIRHAPRLESADVMAGCAEFLTSVCVRAFCAQREQGVDMPLAETQQIMESLTGTIVAETLGRLERRWR
jgi:hypothetical protein